MCVWEVVVVEFEEGRWGEAGDEAGTDEAGLV